HQPVEPQGKQLVDRFLRADPASQLAFQIDSLDNPADHLAVGRPTVASAVQVHKMEVPGSCRDKTARHGDRVVRKDGFAAVVALLQPDTLTIEKIDCRPNLHRVPPTIAHETTRSDQP